MEHTGVTDDLLELCQTKRKELKWSGTLEKDASLQKHWRALFLLQEQGHLKVLCISTLYVQLDIAEVCADIEPLTYYVH